MVPHLTNTARFPTHGAGGGFRGPPLRCGCQPGMQAIAPAFRRTLIIFFLACGTAVHAEPAAPAPANVSIDVSRRAQPSPPFSIQEQEGIAWLTRPTGERFFSLGVCCVEMGASRTNFNPRNPAYAAWRYYPDAAHWADATLKRLQTWGFTTIGGWSDFKVLKQSAATNLAFAPVLHIGSTAGAPWWTCGTARSRIAWTQSLGIRSCRFGMIRG